MRLRPSRLSSLFLRAVVLLVALPAAAQTALQPGTIVALKGPSNRWLSSTPGGKVYFTTNPSPSAWEQWSYGTEGGRPYFESYFGARLMMKVNTNSMIAQPVTGGDFDFATMFMFSFDAAGAVISAPVSGGKVIIGQVPLNPNVRSVYVLMDGTDAPTTTGYSDMTADSARKTFPPWTIVAITAPSAGRGAHQVGLQDMSLYALRSTHGTFLTVPSTSALPATATHTATHSVSIQTLQAKNPAWPINFGQGVTLNYQMATKPASVQPGTGTVSGLPNVVWSDTRFSAVDQWTLVDPTGEHPAGTRVPLGAPVCLVYSNGQALSASNSVSSLYRSSNGCTAGGTWEQWSFSR